MTETNLNSDVSNAELGLHKYVVYRMDRSSETSDKRSGGGVIVAVDKNIPSHQIQVSTAMVESVFVVLSLGHGFKVLLNGVYIPPSKPLSYYQTYCNGVEEATESVGSDSQVLLVGDFNLPGNDWGSNGDVSTSCAARCIKDMSSYLHCKQVNTVCNIFGTTLDLVFSSVPDTLIEEDCDPVLPIDVHHPAIDIVMKLPVPKTPASVLVPNFRKSDLVAIFDRIQLFSYSDYDGDVNSSFSAFVQDMRNAVLANTPYRRIGSSKFPCWFSRELKSLVTQKKILHKQYKETFSPQHYNRFNCVRRRCKELSKICFASYVDHVENTLPHNPKVFWSFINNTRRSPAYPSSMKYDGRMTSEPTEMCSLFADYFASIYAPPEDSYEPVHFDSNGSEFLSNITISLRDVELALASLDDSKGPGPDQIPSSVLKFCSPILSGHLFVLFNRCMKLGVYPDILKNCYIVPIHKSGPVDDVCNYRPIAIQPSLGKVFEKLVLMNMGPLINRQITPQQHGFMSGRSTATNLIVLQQYIISAFGANKQVDVLFLDFSKAFDHVCHLRLVAKLHAFGITGPLLCWFTSYLCGRQMSVKYASVLSTPFPATSGVPQGSILGPMLFNVFINDIVRIVTTDCLLFADDMKIFNVVSSLEDCLVLQRCLEAVKTWCLENCMALNLKKCVALSFHRIESPHLFLYNLDGSVLTRPATVRDLGVVWMASLSAEAHINKICLQASRALGLLIRSTRQLTQLRTLRLLYCANVRPMMEYCAVVWSPHQLTLSSQLELIQNRFLRLVGFRIGYRYHEVPLNTITKLMNLHSLQARRKAQDIIFLLKLVRGTIDCGILLETISFRIPSTTRSCDLFERRYYRTNYARNSTMVRIQRLGNEVAPHLDFFCCGVDQCKRQALTLFEEQL